MIPAAQLPLLPSTDRVAEGVRGLSARFAATASLRDHIRIVDETQVQTQIAWLRRTRKDLWDELRPVIRASWDRHYPQAAEQRAQAKQVAAQMESTRLATVRKGTRNV
jgi:Fe-S cluster assembly scaffold protein SufB